jgi:hypothetical protein
MSFFVNSYAERKSTQLHIFDNSFFNCSAGSLIEWINKSVISLIAVPFYKKRKLCNLIIRFLECFRFLSQGWCVSRMNLRMTTGVAPSFRRET